MATLKVKLRPSSVGNKKGTIYYQLTHRRKVRQITSSVHLLPQDWDGETQCVRPSVADSGKLQNRIDADLRLLRRMIRRREAVGDDYDVDEIVAGFRQPHSRQYVLSYLRDQIVGLRNARRLGTARNYERTLNSFSQFLGGDDIPFGMMTELLVHDYGVYLEQRGIVRNSISFYMRILRSVYNKAVRQHYVEQTFPFQNVYTGIDRTRKRAVGEEVIRQLYRLDLGGQPALDFARDLFIFSYCTRGMAFVDMAYLKKRDVSNGTICYMRHKTRQLLCIKVEAPLSCILDKYALRTQGSPFVFPILRGRDAEEDFKAYQTALNTQNRMLRKLAQLLPEYCKLTSYTSRHTWATAARDHNVPLSVISAGLGHTSERTTRIYLTMLENSVIDSANHLLLQNLQ